MSDINGIHYEISKPVKNPADGYYYQRVRQVDDKGNLVGAGEQIFRSVRPDSSDGLFDRRIDVGRGLELLKDMGVVGYGFLFKNPLSRTQGTAGIVGDLMSRAFTGLQILARDRQALGIAI
jgi:hypothetical protein